MLARHSSQETVASISITFVEQVSHMKTLNCNEKDATLVLSHDEVEIINNAMNEVCHGLDIPEFSTRMGAEVTEVQHLLKQVHAVAIAMSEQSGARSAASTQ